ncbi:MAG: glycosyltransferase family 4 protein [Nitrospirota bacterium]
MVYEYANQLVARGYEVVVVHPRFLRNINPPPNLYRWLRRKAGYLCNLVWRPKVEWQPIDRRVQMIYVPYPTAKYVPNADAVFATAWQTAEYVIKYPPEKGQKFYLIQDFSPYLGPKTRLEATWREPFKKVVYSRWLYDKVIRSGVPKSDIILIPPIGIDHQRFRLLEDIVTRPKRVAMMFSLGSYKAPEDGLKAIEICKKEYKDFQAVMFGLSSRPKVLPSWIKYMANISEEKLVHLYNSSGIFLSSSIAEGFALPPAEAMACGCAVVATDSGGIREYAEHEKTALLSPPRDPEALAKNLLRLLKYDDLRIQLAKAGHKRIQEFTWDQSTDLLEQFLLQHVKI